MSRLVSRLGASAARAHPGWGEPSVHRVRPALYRPTPTFRRPAASAAAPEASTADASAAPPAAWKAHLDFKYMRDHQEEFARNCVNRKSTADVSKVGGER